MKAAVTGAAGFIGSHLVEVLVARGYEVVAIDNLNTGRLENLSSVKNQIYFCNIDVRSPDIVNYLSDVNVVFHLAALADIVPSITKPYEYIDVNVMGTTRLLEAARAAGVKRFIYAASSSCYGIPETFPTTEETVISPQYPYALSKYLGEQVFFHWQKLYGIGGLSLRLFNVYGTRSRTNGSYGAVLGVFLAQKMGNKPLTIVGDGSQKRDFTFVGDVAEAFVLAGESQATDMAINIGTSNPVSVNRLANLIGGSTVHVAKRPGEPDLTHADINRARKVLNWDPKINLEQGIAKVLETKEAWAGAPIWSAEEIEIVTADWFKFLQR